MCCVRVPDEDQRGRRLQEVDSYSTMTRSLLGMADRLACLGVTRVVMEATSDYWKPVFYLLEAAGFETWLVNAKDVKHLPGRPKTDKLDAIWLCKVAERQMIRPSFVPPPRVRRLRDLTRYRADLVAARTAEKNRVEKLLEDAQIKLSVVATDIFGVSGRDMLAALVAGEREPQGAGATGPAEHAQEDHRAGRGVHRLLHRPPRLSAGADAGPGRRDHRRHRRPRRPDRGEISPFTAAVAQLDEIPGISLAAAHAILAETGLDMTRFPTAGHLVSWANTRPASRNQRARERQRLHRPRQPLPGRVLGNAAAAAAKTDTFLGERYRRIARRRGAKKANVAIGRSILVIIWHLLSDPEARYPDLGPDFHATRTDPDRRRRNHIRQLEALGYTVILEPAA